MSRKSKTEKAEKAAKTAIEEAITEETKAEKAKPAEKIDPKVQLVLDMNRSNKKVNEKDRQARIYSAMANIKVIRR